MTETSEATVAPTASTAEAAAEVTLGKPSGPPLTPEIAQSAARIAEAVGTAVVGHGVPLRLTLAAILAGGHVLIEDNPGLGKTLLARSLAGALGLDFRRLQFTPDLLPSDVTGSYLYHPGKAAFDFQPGPVFTGLLLADEINRTPPKTQSALLEAMQEGQVSVEGTTHPLPQPFHVIATANQIEYEGTYALPEAQLDRFLVRTRLGYPPPQAEAEMLRRRIHRAAPDPVVAPVTDAAGLRRLQAGVEQVGVDPDIIGYCVNLAVASRRHPSVEAGVSPRGTQALLLLARAWAALDGRGFVIPEDVKDVAVAALAHRLVLTLQAYQTVSSEDVISQLLATVAAPPSRRGAPRR
ncbi:AAA domain-containing protein [Nakamurella sp. YIM 132087]|uniref:AAA domain-containing protein n=1 Tax=Nakamurella alba TaxID=2665158 RepID=A0A7K1FJ64_9ACTN|nr:MoxR family ATPase [Nakamurella alba]MTD14175.1 AAA domain-containing protein [Nakamurella alba]